MLHLFQKLSEPPSLGMCEFSTLWASTLLSFQHTTASAVPKTPRHFRRRVQGFPQEFWKLYKWTYLQNRKKFAGLEIKFRLPRGGIVSEFGMVMYTLLYLKWITHKDLLYSTWNSAQCYVPPEGSRVWGENETCICVVKYLRCSAETTSLLIHHGAQSLSRVQLFVTPWTVVRQASLSIEFSRPEHWSG